MGRGNKMDYIVCMNSSCKGPPGGGYAWTRGNSGQEACKFCNTPFRVLMRRSGAREAEDDDGWMTQNAKGRSRPVGQQAVGKSSAAASQTQQSQKQKQQPSSQPRQQQSSTRRQHEQQQEQQQQQQDIKKEKLEQEFRQQYKDDPVMLAKADEIWPPKPKSSSELLQDAEEALERAEAAAKHARKVHTDMQNSLVKKSEELLAYQIKVDEKREASASAEAEANEARQALQELKMQHSEESPPAPVFTKAAAIQLAASYNPIQGLIQDLQNDPLLQGVSPEVAQQHLDKLTQRFRSHMNMYAASMQESGQTASASALASSFPSAPSASAMVVQDDRGDVNGNGAAVFRMGGEVGGKQAFTPSFPPHLAPVSASLQTQAHESAVNRQQPQDDAAPMTLKRSAEEAHLDNVSGSMDTTGQQASQGSVDAGAFDDGFSFDENEDQQNEQSKKLAAEETIRAAAQIATNVQAAAAVAAEASRAE